MIGYLPLYLREIKWTAASADGALAASNLASMIVTIPMVLLSSKLSSRKAVLFGAMLVTIISVVLLAVVDGTVLWVLVIMANITRDGFMAVIITMITENKGVGAIYAGTALGLAMTLSRVGGIISPPLGNSLADIYLGLPFIFWAGWAAAGLFGFYFVKETAHTQK
jgi:cyanate permease